MLEAAMAMALKQYVVTWWKPNVPREKHLGAKDLEWCILPIVDIKQVNQTYIFIYIHT